jgi:hypothetical protein
LNGKKKKNVADASRTWESIKVLRKKTRKTRENCSKAGKPGDNVVSTAQKEACTED